MYLGFMKFMGTIRWEKSNLKILEINHELLPPVLASRPLFQEDSLRQGTKGGVAISSW